MSRWAEGRPDGRRGRGARGVAVAATAAFVLAGCGTRVLEPEGPEASRLASVWWLMFGLAAVIYAGVLVVLALALLGRRREWSARGPRLAGMPLVIGGGIVLPSMVVVVLLGVAVWAGGTTRGEGEGAGDLRIELTAHQYWWDVRYPELDVRTANEVHVPVGVDVELVLRSDDVIHSFWVPQLAGKLDHVPGQENRMRLRADRAGRYAGACAEYCGLQHTKMRIEVVAHEPGEFEAWSGRAGAARPTPTDPELFAGWQAFFSGGCSYCHRIEGTPAQSDFGPDLTNLAERATIAAGALPNTRGDLAGWVLDPQQLKPGNAMPATWFEPEELQALLDYLESLR